MIKPDVGDFVRFNSGQVRCVESVDDKTFTIHGYIDCGGHNLYTFNVEDGSEIRLLSDISAVELITKEDIQYFLEANKIPTT